MPFNVDPKALAGSVCALGAALYLGFLSFTTKPAPPTPEPETPSVEITPTVDKFGIVLADYRVDERAVRRNETFSAILSEYGVPVTTVNELVEVARPVFDVRHLRAGKSLRIYQADSMAQLAIYERDPISYLVFELGDSLKVYEQRRPVEIRQRTVSGTITSSPYETLVDQGADPALAVELAEVFAWQVDFYRIQRGDRFDIVYEEQVVDGKPIGISGIVAARFEHVDKDYFAFRFGHDGKTAYYDEHGNTTRRAFLKAPLKYSRISSRYTKRRFHPVLKRYKAHLGTDYAAPTGTPIYATADGIVIAAAYTRGNGRYIKIRHDNTYTTGYLHMSRHAKGMRNGVRVKQGDVIGYVGSTGLATGPHLCYRFWKNGVQVDPLKLDLPTAQPIDDALRPAFAGLRDHFMPLLLGDEALQYALDHAASEAEGTSLPDVGPATAPAP